MLATGIRVIVYRGPREWVEDTFERSYVSKEGITMPNGAKITEITRHIYCCDEEE